MGFLLGIITGLVVAIWLTKLLCKSSLGRTIGAILGIISFKYVINAGTIIRGREETFLWECMELFLESFLFIFGICGIILGILQIIAIIAEIPIPKSIVNLIKVIVTVISFIIAIACIGTGVLSPVGHALAQGIKALWRNNGEP